MTDRHHQKTFSDYWVMKVARALHKREAALTPEAQQTIANEWDRLEPGAVDLYTRFAQIGLAVFSARVDGYTRDDKVETFAAAMFSTVNDGISWDRPPPAPAPGEKVAIMNRLLWSDLKDYWRAVARAGAEAASVVLDTGGEAPAHNDPLEAHLAALPESTVRALHDEVIEERGE